MGVVLRIAASLAVFGRARVSLGRPSFGPLRPPAHVGVLGIVFLFLLPSMARPEIAAATERAIPVFGRCDVLVVEGMLAVCVSS